MNNTIETYQSYQIFKEILTARHIISQWLWARLVLLHQVCSQPACQQSPNDCYSFDKTKLVHNSILIAAN